MQCVWGVAYLERVANGGIQRIGVRDEEDANKEENAVEKGQVSRDGLHTPDAGACRTHELELLVVGRGLEVGDVMSRSDLF